MNSSVKVQFSDYAMLAHLFIELRGKGLSLSTADLDILKSWELSGIKAEFIANVMHEYAEECKQKSKNFPNSLLPVYRKVHAILLKSSEY
jgi:hypothetical protein